MIKATCVHCGEEIEVDRYNAWHDGAELLTEHPYACTAEQEQDLAQAAQEAVDDILGGIVERTRA